MTKFITVAFVLLLSLTGCSTDASESKCKSARPVAAAPTTITREWSLYSRECSIATPSDCADWNIEALALVDVVTELETTVGGWYMYMLDATVTSDAEEVTLWFQYKATTAPAWQVTTRCSSEDTQETVTLFDNPNGKYYEVTVLCAVTVE